MLIVLPSHPPSHLTPPPLVSLDTLHLTPPPLSQRAQHAAPGARRLSGWELHAERLGSVRPVLCTSGALQDRWDVGTWPLVKPSIILTELV
jgi:hypothetical protein